jgi:hypothetical protein
MSSKNTLTALESYCSNSTGNPNKWQGKSGLYQWSLGRDSSDRVTNGVVRKFAGTSLDGKEIWTVAGSFKIKDTGEIIRFTGLPKKVQAVIQAITVTETDTVEQ